jgi:hypothetical protein
MTIRFGSFPTRFASWVVGAASTLPVLSACAQTAPPVAAPTSEPVASTKDVMPSGTYTNPVLDADRPDPDVLRVGNTFYMLHTMGGVPAWPLYTSSDLTHWQFTKHLLTRNSSRWKQIRSHLHSGQQHQQQVVHRYGFRRQSGRPL